MNVSFLKDNPVNSTIVDSKDGRPLYEIRTPWKVSGRTTTIRRLQPGVAPGAGEVVAEVRWRALGSDTITLYGSTMRVKDWLSRGGIFTSSRILTTSDGNQYKWSYGSRKFTLKHTNTNAEAAQSHRSKHGWFGGSSRKMNIDISPQGMHFLDTIIVSFIIMEEKLRQANTASANANSMAATTAATTAAAASS